MEKITFSFLILLFSVTTGFSQDITLVAIDNDNSNDPTLTGSALSLSSEGFTIGLGISPQIATAAFTANNWVVNGTEVDATEYFQWSITADTGYDVVVNGIQIELRRNISGPNNYVIQYSTDNFATPGTIAGSGTLPVDLTNYNPDFTGLNISSGTGGTITFRLYAWGATANAGWLRVMSVNSWDELGIDNAGALITGTVTANTPNSTESDIISTDFDPADNFIYSNYNDTSGLTTENALMIGEFEIRDGGASAPDADDQPTILTDLGFTISNYENIATLALMDALGTNVAEITSVGENTQFLDISGLQTEDDESNTFSLYATFKTEVTDNDQIQVTITDAAADAINGSSFASIDAGGAATPIVGDDNRIEVTAVQIVFDQQPTDTNIYVIMTPYPTLQAVDNNLNIDLDYAESFTVSSSGSMEPPAGAYSFVNGIAILDEIMFTAEGSNIWLTVTIGTPPIPSFTAYSELFNVNGPLFTIAQQDFDGSTPEWPYTTDLAFFGSTWGEAYYGIVDAASATPLSKPEFSGNILGINDLSDGTTPTTYAIITFEDVNVSIFDNMILTFDWEVIGFNNDNDDVLYQLVIDGIGQGYNYLFDGNSSSSITDGSGSEAISIPDTASTVGLQIQVSNNNLNDFAGFDNFKLKTAFDGLVYSNNNWLNSEAPDGTTNAEDALILSGTYNVGTNIGLNHLLINENAAVTISLGQSLTLNGNMINNGTLELNSASTSYSSLIVSGTVNGEVIYNRHVNENQSVGGNDLIAPPLVGQTFGEFAANNSNILSNPSIPSQKLFGPFEKSSGTYLLYDSVDNANTMLMTGTGYRAASSDTGGSTFAFEGNVITEDINIPITNSGPSYSIWNLIGNPYPSYVKLSEFLSANNSKFNSIKSGVYGYDGNAQDGWTIWNQAYSDANINAKITPGQGFYVSCATSSANINFTTSMRTTGTTDDFIAGRMDNTSPHKAFFSIELFNENSFYQTEFYLNDNASLSFDQNYDSALFGNIPSFSVYSNLVEGNDNSPLGIQSLPGTISESITIPLGVEAKQGQQINFSLSNSTLDPSAEVYLEDNVKNTWTLLNTSNYSLTTDADLSGVGRFYLHLSANALGIEHNLLDSLKIYSNSNSIRVVGDIIRNTSLKVYDIQGRLVLSENTPKDTTSHTIDTSNLSHGTYVIQIENENGKKTKKLIL
ncbi:T9SS type A sorting domain-containing protein [Mangrovimonas xylaniphaga]|uniref:T9SS type A sorting domain-containing protein n=1 Tax=Mangrovimonas xylaniphaga TaxID=1645915 RepID=UPI0006B650BA|nr:T9SS type A sorting domain-containing protein [Mangrovimonas xylaniphaga]